LICDYVSDKALITLTTKEGEIYSGEMNIDIQIKKTTPYSLRSQNSTNRKCIIQVSNCGQPFNKAIDEVFVAVTPYPSDRDVFGTFPAKNIGGGLYECIIPDRTAYYINPQGVCNWTKDKLIWITDNIICNFFTNPTICPIFMEFGSVGIEACEVLQGH